MIEVICLVIYLIVFCIATIGNTLFWFVAIGAEYDFWEVQLKITFWPFLAVVKLLQAIPRALGFKLNG